MKAIHVLRKPCAESTVVANVLTHGCGGLNIDAARVGFASSVDSESAASLGTSFAKSRAAGRIIQSASIGEWRNRADYYTPGSGRWPANLVLQHLDGCKQTGVREDSFNTAVPGTFGASIMDGRAGLGGLGSTPIYGHVSTTTPVYECAEGCPVAALDAQSGILKSGALPTNQYATEHAGSSVFAGAGVWESKAYGSNEGGASRFFKQFGSSS